MKTITNTFSFRRLWDILRIDLRAYTSARMMYVGILFIFLANQLGEISHCIAYFKLGAVNASQLFATYIDGLAPVFYAFLIGMLLYAISTVSNMGEKETATYYLMLPASNREKFVSRVLIALVEPIVGVILTMLIVDLIRIGIVEYRMGVNPDYAVLSADFKGLTVPDLLAHAWQTIQLMFTHGGTEYVNAEGYISMAGFGFSAFRGVMVVTFSVVALLFAHSLFLLIGCCWSNFTVISITILGVALWLLREKAIDAIVSAGDVTVSAYGNLLQGGAVWSIVLLLILVILTIVNWCVSFRFFTRKQVVMPTSQMFNFIKRLKQ